jgi:hypothetical protein
LTLGGRTLMKAGYDLESLMRRLDEGWSFRKTTLSDEFSFDRLCSTLSEQAQVLLALKEDGDLNFATVDASSVPRDGDTVISFVPPTPASDRLC